MRCIPNLWNGLLLSDVTVTQTVVFKVELQFNLDNAR